MRYFLLPLVLCCGCYQQTESPQPIIVNPAPQKEIIVNPQPRRNPHIDIIVAPPPIYVNPHHHHRD